jgi:drug/metabolite transporter (DMT)-like permease
MSGLRSLSPSRGIIFGLVAALGIGFFGSWAGSLVAASFEAGPTHDYVTVSAAFVVGAVGGAFGRHYTGLLVLCLGIVAAALLKIGVEPPTFDVMPTWAVALLLGALGYAIGRMVDPIWGGRAS